MRGRKVGKGGTGLYTNFMRSRNKEEGMTENETSMAFRNRETTLSCRDPTII